MEIVIATGKAIVDPKGYGCGLAGVSGSQVLDALVRFCAANVGARVVVVLHVEPEASVRPYRIDREMPMTVVDGDTIYPPECDHGSPPCRACYEAGKIRRSHLAPEESPGTKG